ncbi:MAG: hypothetical protein Q9195_006595 [Heterodermia aff. obscurata]
MLSAEQIAPAFHPNIAIYPCRSCVHFAMIKSEKVIADFIHHVNAAGILSPSPHPNVLKNAIKALLGYVIKERVEPEYPLPTAAAIKANPEIPVFVAAGGGTLYDFKNQRKEYIAIYKCNACRALYVLPEDFRAAGKALEYPTGFGGMTPGGIQDLCIQAMQNAYQGLGIGKAEVYCFKNFVVMIDMKGMENSSAGRIPEMSPLT